MANQYAKDKMIAQRGVPIYDVVQIAPKKCRYVAFVFVINEGARIQHQLREMAQFSCIVDIVVADGGSSDGSLQLAFLEATKCSAILTKKGEGGLSAQMRMAFDYALKHGYEGIITLDGNGKDGIDALPDFVSLLESGYDHIQGSRFIRGGHHANTPLLRHIALKLVHAPLISWASRTRQTDTTNGFRGYSLRLISDKEVDVFRPVFQTYELHYHLAIESGRRREFRNIETPVSRIYPHKGKTPTKISFFRGNISILLILFRAVSGVYKSKKSKVSQDE